MYTYILMFIIYTCIISQQIFSHKQNAVCVCVCMYLCILVFIYEENKGIKIIKMNTGFSRSDGENFSMR